MTMTNVTLTHPALAQALWPATTGNRVVRAILLIAAGCALLTISAKIQVPFWPVPMTMQTFVVIVLGAALGWRLAGATVLAYLVQGAAGLPVFAGGAGLAYVAGPTGGYLVGFLAGAVVVGWLAEKGWDRHFATSLLAMVLGIATVFALGVGYLATLIGLQPAITAGLLPFLAGEALKIALAMAVMPLAWRFLAQR
jgi:biotin transport system substrate-specific component